jgi:vacuolar-type H+-ATPase subunit F/Vma7
MDENKNNIFYRPNLDYDKNYETIDNTSKTTTTTTNTETPITERLTNTISSIKNLYPLFPEDIQSLIDEPLTVIENVIGNVTPSTPTKTPTIEEIITPTPTPQTPSSDDNTSNSSSDTDWYPDSFFRDDDDSDPITITIVNHKNIKVIKDDYDYDLVSIIDDYVNNLKDTVNNYVNNIVPIFRDIDKSLYPLALEKYTGYTKDVSKDFKHLSDLVIRSQLVRDMKSKLYKKLFSLDKTISHVRACKVSIEQRLRYYEADYQEAKDFSDVVSNRFLENSRMMYDEKYKQNFTNLYKYLNSSVILLNECFNMSINEIQAKTILLTKEGN